jgi:hypothetical protein
MEFSVFLGIEAGTVVEIGCRRMFEGMDDCALGATGEEELFWERTGIRERRLLEAARAGIEVWTVAKVANPSNVRVGLAVRQEDIMASWRKRKREEKRWAGEGIIWSFSVRVVLACSGTSDFLGLLLLFPAHQITDLVRPAIKVALEWVCSSLVQEDEIQIAFSCRCFYGQASTWELWKKADIRI